MASAPLPEIQTRSVGQLAQAVRRLRRLKGLTQAQLAQLASIRQPTVSSLESGAPGTELATVFTLLTAMDLELVLRPRRKSAPSAEELVERG